MKLTKDESQWLKEAAAGSFPKIDDSTYFLSLFTKNVADDPLCALQIGYAILQNKPIYLVAEQGVAIPEVLRRVAKGIETYAPDDTESLSAAVTRVCTAAATTLEGLPS